MSSLFSVLQNLNPSIKKIYEYRSFLPSNETLWTSIARDSNSNAFSGGTHSNQLIARTKCLYEGIERSYINELSRNGESSFAIKEFASSNGFACGPTKDFATNRAILEGIERYCWDQWIDQKITLSEASISISNISKFLLEDFTSHQLLSAEIISETFGSQPLLFNVCIGHFNDGVFWGSELNMKNGSENVFEHAIVEANRNLKTFRTGICINSNMYEDLVLQKYGTSGLCETRLSIAAIPKLHLIPNKFILLKNKMIFDDVWIARCILDQFVEKRDPKRMAFW